MARQLQPPRTVKASLGKGIVFNRRGMLKEYVCTRRIYDSLFGDISDNLGGAQLKPADKLQATEGRFRQILCVSTPDCEG